MKIKCNDILVVLYIIWRSARGILPEFFHYELSSISLRAEAKPLVQAESGEHTNGHLPCRNNWLLLNDKELPQIKQRGFFEIGIFCIQLHRETNSMFQFEKHIIRRKQKKYMEEAVNNKMNTKLFGHTLECGCKLL